jgi:thymidylate synthase
MMMAQVCDLKLGNFVHALGDAYIYDFTLENYDPHLAIKGLVAV